MTRLRVQRLILLSLLSCAFHGFLRHLSPSQIQFAGPAVVGSTSRISTDACRTALSAEPSGRKALLQKALEWEAMELQPDDMEGLDRLRQLVASDLKEKKWSRVDETVLKKQLIGAKMDVEKAYDRLCDLVEWQSKMFPIDPAFIKPEVQEGYLLLHGEDRQGHPVLYTICRKYDVTRRDLDRCVAHIVNTVEMGIRRMPSGVGKFLVVFDARGLGWRQVDFKVIVQAIMLLEKRYPVRTYRLCAVGLPRIFNFLWRFAKKILDPLSASKVQFINDVDGLQELVEVDQMPDLLRAEVSEEQPVP